MSHSQQYLEEYGWNLKKYRGAEKEIKMAFLLFLAVVTWRNLLVCYHSIRP